MNSNLVSPLNRGKGELGLIRVSSRPQGTATDWMVCFKNMICILRSFDWDLVINKFKIFEYIFKIAGGNYIQNISIYLKDSQ